VHDLEQKLNTAQEQLAEYHVLLDEKANLIAKLKNLESLFASLKTHNNNAPSQGCPFSYIADLEDEVRKLKLQLAESLSREDWSNYQNQKLKLEFDELQNTDNLRMTTKSEIDTKPSNLKPLRTSQTCFFSSRHNSGDGLCNRRKRISFKSLPKIGCLRENSSAIYRGKHNAEFDTISTNQFTPALKKLNKRLSLLTSKLTKAPSED